jgi:hypothetical protein
MWSRKVFSGHPWLGSLFFCDGNTRGTRVEAIAEEEGQHSVGGTVACWRGLVDEVYALHRTLHYIKQGRNFLTLAARATSRWESCYYYE